MFRGVGRNRAASPYSRYHYRTQAYAETTPGLLKGYFRHLSVQPSMVSQQLGRESSGRRQRQIHGESLGISPKDVYIVSGSVGIGDVVEYVAPAASGSLPILRFVLMGRGSPLGCLAFCLAIVSSTRFPFHSLLLPTAPRDVSSFLETP